MRTKRLIPIFFFLVLSAPLARVEAQGETFSFRLPSYELYAPAKIIISFVYTNNVTTNVRTLGTSLYKITTSPVQVIFEAEAFDVYTIDIRIEYSIPINQTVIIGLYEGGRATKGIEFDTTVSVILLTIKVSVVEAPTYPTAEEIANSLANWLQSYLSEYTMQISNTVNQMGESMLVIGVLGVIAFVVSIAVLVAVFYVNRRVAELSEWGIRHESEHSKGG
jgi:hypothetical protein